MACVYLSACPDVMQRWKLQKLQTTLSVITYVLHCISPERKIKERTWEEEEGKELTEAAVVCFHLL